MQWKTDLDYVSILVACVLVMGHKSYANRFHEVDDGIGPDLVLESLAKVELTVTDIGQRLGHLQDVLSTHTVQMANIMNVQRIIMRDEKKTYLKMKRCRRDMRTVLKSCTCEARNQPQKYYLYDSNKRVLVDGQYKREQEFEPTPISLQETLSDTSLITKGKYVHYIYEASCYT